ncbi:DUF99 family protein [Haloglomus salinum]|uniref:endonuclease dU n=1 Tax=Haloglomus salinum TaxID=2962673 RepID=UPI0020C9D7CA|nr:DUF99 family protein [Haloglomus salinum]
MNQGVRALGVAESTGGGRRATVAGSVVRADRTFDDLVLDSWTVGGTDATDTVIDCWEHLDREDVRYLLVAGIAPAWFNVLDLRAIHDATERPVLSVSFEASEGLEPALRDAFGDDPEALEVRLATYDRQPPRERVEVNGETCFVRAVGCEAAEAREVIDAFTPEGGRPEPVRVARLCARGGDDFRHRLPDGD